MKVLFLSLTNSNRGPKAAQVYRNLMNKKRHFVEVRTAGIDPFSSAVVDNSLIEWAERIFVMENYMVDYLPAHAHKKVTVLDVPKINMQNQLVGLLNQKFSTLQP